MTRLERTIEAIKKKWNEYGNGSVIEHNNGKRYELWVQEDGHFLISDKVNIWMEETYCKRFNTIEELAQEIMSL